MNEPLYMCFAEYPGVQINGCTPRTLIAIKKKTEAYEWLNEISKREFPYRRGRSVTREFFIEEIEERNYEQI